MMLDYVNINIYNYLELCFVLRRVCGCYFFFFQAEDGIRDYKVTGVQTCALPIWVSLPDAWRRLAAVRAGHLYAVDGAAYFNRPGPRVVDGLEILAELIHPEVFRSEERRVGKECRSRWSPYH